MGSMWKAVKALDLRRDPRFALHSGSADPPAEEGSDEGAGWDGDAKVAGRVVEITDPDRVREANGEGGGDGPSHLFRADITELVLIGLDEPREHMVIESWREGRGVSRKER